jgi:hypothetical protein
MPPPSAPARISVELPPRIGPSAATSIFDSVTNQTSVYTKQDVTLVSQSGRKLALAPIFTVNGYGVATPRTVLLRFYVYSSDADGPMADECEIEVIADHTDHWALARVAHDTTSQGGTKVEGIGQEIPYYVFAGMVGSQHVSIKVGRDRFTLTPAQLEPLRDMQRCIQDGRCE